MTLKSFFLFSLSAVSLMFVTSCATNINMSKTTNPPPSEAFQAFTSFEMEPVKLAPAYADSGANKKALAKIQERLTAHTAPTLALWNRTGAEKSSPRRTLVITPVVREIKFIGGAARFWGGWMAGSSAVITQITFTEKETGKVVATPEFYARAGAFVGAMAIGATDNLMLDRVAETMSNYIHNNYATAVGGITGAGT